MSIEPKITAKEVSEYLKISVQAVHQKIKSLKLKTQKSQNKTYFSFEASKQIIHHKFNKKIPIIISLSVVKGGVGKTTIAEALAIKYSLYGLRTLCIDVDQQSNLTKGLQAEIQAKNTPVMIDLISGKANDASKSILNIAPGLDLLPSRLDNVTLDGYLMLHRINPSTIFNLILQDIAHNYDIILIDCPPTLGSTVCASILFSDMVIAPLNPDVYSYEGINIMKKEISTINKQFYKDINWRILLNKFDTRTILSSDYLSEILNDEDYKNRIFQSVVRTSREFPNIKRKEKSIFDTLRNTIVKEDITSLANEILSIYK